MSGERRFFGGSSLQQALFAAARHFQIDAAEVAWEPVEKKHGYLRSRHRVMITVDPAAPRRRSAPAAAPPTVPKQDIPVSAAAGSVGAVHAAPAAPRPPRPRPEPAPGEAADRVRDAAELLRALADLNLEILVGASPDGGLVADFAGPDEGRVTAHHGQVLRAVEHLLPRLVRGLGGGEVVVRPECGGFHAQETERLQALAREVADDVRRSGRSRSLPPMSPGERRSIHLSLVDDPAVLTESVGDGYLKRVVVRLREPGQGV